MRSIPSPENDWLTERQKSCTIIRDVFVPHNKQYVVNSTVREQSQEECSKGETMTDRELRKLSRADLLELLLEQSRENEQLRKQLEQAEAKLADRKIEIEHAGSIAEAALRLNGVFEAAEQAAAQYLDNVRRIAEESHEEK